MKSKYSWARWYDVACLEKATPIGLVPVITVRKRSGRGDVSWDRLQQIKDDVVGGDAVAIEMYPAASDVVNEANLRHLWVVPAGLVPFNLNRR